MFDVGQSEELTKLHHHLGSPVVSGLDDGGVMLVVKRCAPEVDQPYLRILQNPDLPALLTILVRLEVFIVVAAVEQDVLRLQVGVSQAVRVQEGDGETELVRDLSDVLQGVGSVVVVLQEVKYALP